MPFNIFADEGTPEEVSERTENVNSDSIICETLTIAPDKDGGNWVFTHLF